MAKSIFNQKPNFLWQGLLIVLPVVVLSAVGGFSLRQDRILAQHEAAGRAQTIADDLASKIWDALTGTNNAFGFQGLRFQIDSTGHLIFPPPFTTVPQPLNSTETPSDNARAIANYTDAVSLASQGKYQEAADSFEAIVKNFPDAIGETGLRLGPLAQWRLLELQNLTTNRVAIKRPITSDSFWSNTAYHPTPLTPYFLQLASEHDRKIREFWQPLWEEHSRSRELYSAVRQRLGVEDRSTAALLTVEGREGALGLAANNSTKVSIPSLFWFQTPETVLMLAIRYDDTPAEAADGTKLTIDEASQLNGPAGSQSNALLAPPTNYWLVLRTESEIDQRITALVHASHIPEYFGVGVLLAGKKLTGNALDLRVWRNRYSMSKGGGHAEKDFSSELDPGKFVLATEILASATRSEAGTDLLKVNIYLTSPTTLFYNQRTRTFWFGSLIAVSAGAALIGLITAWRAFNRQQQLSEMKSNFVSSVSHELRAPIASVRLMAESLERGKISDALKQGEYFRFIVQECRRLTSLIENVLDFSRIEQGRKQYEFEPTDVSALVEQTVKLMEPYSAEKGVKLEILPSLDLPATLSPSDGERIGARGQQGVELNVDGRAIQQALLNLIDNAIKHSPKGETVTVGLECGQSRTGVSPVSDSGVGTADVGGKPETARVLLWIEDHGEGIPPEEHEKIFERFYRLGSELRRETQGVGIGLSIVKHTVEAHGGKVHVRSAVGQGSRFTIELPSKENHE